MSDATWIEASVEVEGEAFTALSLSVRQALMEVGEAVVEITDEAAGPRPGKVLGGSAQVALRRDDGASEMRFAGVVVEASHHGLDSERPFTRLVIRPRLWRLALRRDHRFFGDEAVDAIVTEVLEEAGITEHEWRLTGSYPPRVATVQHGESDLAFVLRLLTEEGIAFAVEARDGVDHVVFFDGDLGDVAGERTLPYAEEGGFDHARDAVEHLELGVQLRSGKVVLRDYDFARPDFELKGEAQADAGHDLETYQFPARHDAETEVGRYAQTLLEALQVDGELVAGGSQAFHLAPGRRFAIEHHPLDAVNRDLLVLQVEHHYQASRWAAEGAGTDGASVRFVAMPAARPYRPPPRPVAQRVAGYESAVVVGPAGSEIHPDEYGRVKAQPLWDRRGDGTDASATWMRCFQAPLGGGQLTPRVGWEVTLRHVEGDPDRPCVAGRMYTQKAPPPYALPEHKTRSVIQTTTSPGGEGINELRFDDKKGAEEMALTGSKDMSVSAGNNATETVGGNETRTITANQEVNVTGAMEAVAGSQSWSISGSQQVGVSTYLVDQVNGHSLNVGGTRTVMIGGDHRALVGGASSIDVNAAQVDLVVGSVTDSTTATLDDTIGGALVEIAGGGRDVVCTSRAETVGAVKAVLASGGRGVTVGGAMTHTVGAALAVITKADLNDNSKGSLMDVAAGAHLVKATEVTFTAETLLTVICGGSTLTLTPGSVTLAGATITLDGVTPQDAALIKDN